jgi:multiple antibiotic resistance protein
MEQLLFVLIKFVPISIAALMPVINPIGTSIILLGMTQGASDATRRKLARAIGINTVVLLTTILIGGSYVLSFFGITVPIVQAAGGLVLAAMGWRMLNQTDGGPGEQTADQGSALSDDYSQKAFYPFTFPLTVGPGGVAVALTLSAHATHGTFVNTIVGQAGAFIGIVAIGFVMYFCFAYSNAIAKRLGPAGLSVLMRLLAFIVLCLGASISWSGIAKLIVELPARAS